MQAHAAEPPSAARWLWPSIALGVVGLLLLIWAGSSTLDATQRTVVGNFFTTELAGPGSYESELAPGTYQIVLFDLDQSEVTVGSGSTSVALTFRDGSDLSLRQSSGNSSVAMTVPGKRVADFTVNNFVTHTITLGADGTVFTNTFDTAQRATSTGGSPFASAGLGDAVADNAVPLMAGASGLILGLVGIAIAMRAKSRHKKQLAFEERSARNAARIAANK